MLNNNLNNKMRNKVKYLFRLFLVFKSYLGSKYILMDELQVEFKSSDTEPLYQEMAKRIAEIDKVASDFPGVIIIHNVEDFSISYLSPRGLSQLGMTLEEARLMTSEEYHSKYFNEDDAKDYVPKLRALLAENTDESISFCHLVRIDENLAWTWRFS